MSDKREFNLIGSLADDYSLRLDFATSDSFKRILFPLKGKKLEIKFKELEYKRSDAQNRYYWGVVIPTIRAFLKEVEGKKYTKDEVHFYNLYNVQEAKPRIVEVFGIDTIVLDAKKSSEMSTAEFSDFVELLQKYWAEKDCIIPDPQKHNFITEFIDNGSGSSR